MGLADLNYKNVAGNKKARYGLLLCYPSDLNVRVSGLRLNLNHAKSTVPPIGFSMYSSSTDVNSSALYMEGRLEQTLMLEQLLFINSFLFLLAQKLNFSNTHMSKFLL